MTGRYKCLPLAVLAVALGCRSRVEQRQGAVVRGDPVRQQPTAGPTSPPSEVVYKVGNGVTAPRLIRKVAPDVADACAKTRWFDGEAFVFEALVTPEGDVREVRTIKSPRFKPPCSELEKAYRVAISQWKYEPARFEGRPVAVELTISVAFHI